MQAELTASGFQDLHSAEAVENAMKEEGSCSELCMCCAANARPGAKMSLEGQKRPDLNYCFAGVDKDAVDAARQHMFPFLHHHQLWPYSKTAN
jgi:putative YphP/YqiW family bacilliredoxin